MSSATQKIDLATWSKIDRDGLLGELDMGVDLGKEAAEAAKAYRAEHGWFPHPGGIRPTITLTGMAPETVPLELGGFITYSEPRLYSTTMDQVVLAAKTVGGKTSVLSRYYGGGKSSGPGWVEV